MNTASVRQPAAARQGAADEPLPDDQRELNMILFEHARQMLLEADPTLLPGDAKHRPLAASVPCVVENRWQWEKRVRGSQLLSFETKGFLLLLATYMNTRPREPKGWSCHPTEQTLAHNAGRSKSTVREYRRTAKESGFLTWRRGGRSPQGKAKANDYEPRLPPRSVAWHVVAAYLGARASTRQLTDGWAVPPVDTPAPPADTPAPSPADTPAPTTPGVPEHIHQTTDHRVEASSASEMFPVLAQEEGKDKRKGKAVVDEIADRFSSDVRSWPSDKLQESYILADQVLACGVPQSQIIERVTRRALPDGIDPGRDHSRMAGLVKTRLKRVLANAPRPTKTEAPPKTEWTHEEIRMVDDEPMIHDGHRWQYVERHSDGLWRIRKEATA